MHFNDICMRLRNLAITGLAAAIGLAAYSTKEHIVVDVLGGQIPIGTVIASGALVGWVAFYAMDVHWYHMFLRAAGIHAGRIEERWRTRIPELMLSSQISESSRRTIGTLKFDSTRRLTTFYGIGAIVLILTGIVVWDAHTITPQNPTTSLGGTNANEPSSPTAAPPRTSPATSPPGPEPGGIGPQPSTKPAPLAPTNPTPPAGREQKPASVPGKTPEK